MSMSYSFLPPLLLCHFHYFNPSFPNEIFPYPLTTLENSKGFLRYIQVEQKYSISNKWGKVFKNGPYEVSGRQPLKNVTWSILEYFVPDGLRHH